MSKTSGYVKLGIPRHQRTQPRRRVQADRLRVAYGYWHLRPTRPEPRYAAAGYEILTPQLAAYQLTLHERRLALGIRAAPRAPGDTQ
jgi:hypothetical protein